MASVNYNGPNGEAAACD